VLRVLPLVALIVVALVPASAPAAVDTGSASLTISVWPKGRGGGQPVRSVTLRCRPDGGDHPRPGYACARLFANLGALSPVPPSRVCTAIYGGPQQALVAGSVNGRRVRATFNRRNGCEIFRWSRLAVLFVRP
jgi:Subtilisin inhibitor-like